MGEAKRRQAAGNTEPKGKIKHSKAEKAGKIEIHGGTESNRHRRRYLASTKGKQAIRREIKKAAKEAARKAKLAEETKAKESV